MLIVFFSFLLAMGAWGDSCPEDQLNSKINEFQREIVKNSVLKLQESGRVSADRSWKSFTHLIVSEDSFFIPNENCEVLHAGGTMWASSTEEICSIHTQFTTRTGELKVEPTLICL